MPAMLSLRLILGLLAVGAPLLVWGAMAAREKILVAAAVSAEHKAGLVRCAANIKAIETTHNSQVEDAARAARDAGDAIETPDDDQELMALCRRSASCRSRGAK